MDSGPLSARVATFCDQLAPHVPVTARDQVFYVRRHVGEPVRVALAGRLNAGKLTLVHALIRLPAVPR